MGFALLARSCARHHRLEVRTARAFSSLRHSPISSARPGRPSRAVAAAMAPRGSVIGSPVNIASDQASAEQDGSDTQNAVQTSPNSMRIGWLRALETRRGRLFVSIRAARAAFRPRGVECLRLRCGGRACASDSLRRLSRTLQGRASVATSSACRAQPRRRVELAQPPRAMSVLRGHVWQRSAPLATPRCPAARFHERSFGRDEAPKCHSSLRGRARPSANGDPSSMITRAAMLHSEAIRSFLPIGIAASQARRGAANPRISFAGAWTGEGKLEAIMRLLILEERTARRAGPH